MGTNCKMNSEIVERKNNEEANALFEARDINAWLLTYLKAVEYALLDYINGDLKEEPDVAYTIMREFIDKSIDSAIRIKELLEIESNLNNAKRRIDR